MPKTAKKAAIAPRGPKPDRLMLKGDWKLAVKKSLAKKNLLRDGPKRCNIGGMKRVLLIVWMVFCLVAGGLIVICSPLTLINALAKAHGNIPYLGGVLIGIAIGALLLGEFNRARKTLKKSKQTQSA